ncbi:CIA machinery monothiol glutaredoxin Grx4 [Schizosaccharomyces pombe]|uniref:Monothiol glutaredoxin-4 n=1 Tax=Schizosaccharomyces pombe (strain 972 / ATCC 24843) TaxID=284812 RepID=GLRX4_SCHPO|nr:glutaredoxin Grx4 [Schizosaccharomyces pombe]O74790.1 RecName: Full=Monothiol glutaredoxin-4 [Schizosaccharomyces pombe 972h-]AAR08197.1 monothiol glutaredoxin [Schizosaccharomyces pombe]CAA21098.1 glutaredoxin Grx4 [Schizosaccharomyces pombe]|eukprot:NP_596647.1 glutaredoxin Grx4 [Schizosaccharomyces pombe]
MSVEITFVEQFQEILQNGKEQIILLNFYAPWAAPCKQMNQVFDQFAKDTKNAVFLKIEAEKFSDIAESFDVNAVPLFVLIHGAKVLARISGANPQKLKAAIDEYIQPLISQISSTNASVETQVNSVQTTNTTSNTSKAPNGLDSELNERLSTLTNAHNVMLFLKGTPSEPACGFSRKLVGLLREQNVQYGFFNILADDSVRQGLKVFSDWPTFPQLYIKGEFVGGLDIVSEMIENGELQEMLPN